MDRVSVILPTYNESESIVAFVKEVAKVLSTAKRTYEIIVVDDNSPDGTASCVSIYAKKMRATHIRVIVRKKDRGLGNSIKEGILQAKGSIIVGMDADFNHDPETLPLLLQTLNNADLVVASRLLPGGGMADWIRLIPTVIVNRVFQLLGMPVTDNTSGYYAIKKASLHKLGLDKIYYGYGDYHLRLVAFAHKQNLSILEVPTFYKARRGGVSKSQFMTMFVTYFREVVRLRSIPNISSREVNE